MSHTRIDADAFPQQCEKRTSTGNVGAVIDALGHRTEYTYSWGRVSQTVTKQYQAEARVAT
jgi:hypothetical protein